MPEEREQLFKVAVRFARRRWREATARSTMTRPMAEGLVAVLLMDDGPPRRILIEACESLVNKAAENRWVYDNLIEAANDLMTGPHHLLTPDWLRQFAQAAHSGTLPRPTRRGPRDNERRIFRDVKIRLVTEIVKDHFCIGLYSKGQSKGRSAAHVVVEALEREGTYVTIDTVIRACNTRER